MLVTVVFCVIPQTSNLILVHNLVGSKYTMLVTVVFSVIPQIKY